MESNDNPRNIKMDDFSKMLDINERIKFLLNFAVLAPSTHNTQPWLFKIRNSGCEIFYDPKLSLPEADVKQRDLYISMGCCIENLSLASKYFGMFDSVDFGPFTEKHQVAVIKFREHPSEKNQDFREILNTIVARRNARGIFSGEKVPKDVVVNVSNVINEYLVDGIHVHWVEEKDNISSLASLTAEGLKSAYYRPSFRKEMARWMNNSLTRKKEGIPGYALKMPLFLSFILPTMVKWFNIGNFLAKKNYQSISSAPLIVVITAQDSNPNIWLKVGRLAERLMLEFNSRNWQTSIF